MCPFAIKRSNDFAEKNGLPKYEYVLHPRTTGFVHFINEMKKGDCKVFKVDKGIGCPTSRKSRIKVGNLIVRSEESEMVGNRPSRLEKWRKNK